MTRTPLILSMTLQTMRSTRAPGLSRALPVAAALAVLAASPAAHAADPPATAPAATAKAPTEGPGTAAKASADPKADTVEKADALFREGVRFVTQQRWADAENKFLAAFALNQTYDVANNLGQTQYRMGKYRDAAEHLAYAVQHWPLIGKKDARDLALKRLDEVKKQVGALKVSINAQGAEVSVDGTTVGRSPLEVQVFVEAGPHLVIARLAGYDEARADVKSQKGEEQEVNLTLVKSPRGPEAGAFGRSNGGSVGGGGSGGPGPGDGGKDQPAGANKAVLIAGGATAGVALVAGVVFTVLANGKAADADALMGTLRQRGAPDPCKTYSADCDSIERSRVAQGQLASGALISFLGAGVVGLGTLGYALLAPQRRSAAHARVVPVVSATQPGLIVEGTW